MEEIAKKIYEKANELSSMISESKLKDIHFAMVLHVPQEDGDNTDTPNCIGVLTGRPIETAKLLNKLIADTDMAKYLALDRLREAFKEFRAGDIVKFYAAGPDDKAEVEAPIGQEEPKRG
jgi:hypothetical protein